MEKDGERNRANPECTTGSDATISTPDPVACCKCDPCCCCHFYSCNDFNIEFFIKPLSDHYNHLRQHVFTPLSTINEGWDSSFFPSKIIILLPKNSEFYDDARRHMSKKMKNNIVGLEDCIAKYNDKVENDNKMKTLIDSQIRNASNNTSNLQLSEDARRNLHSILQHMLQEVLRSTGDIQDRIKQFDMKTQMGYGFKPEDKQIAHVVFDAVLSDDAFINEVKIMRDIMHKILEYKEAIKTQAGEISIEMKNNTYRVKRRCCPILWTELWKIMGFSFR